MSFPDDYRRLLRASGFVIWGIVGFPVAVFQLAGSRAARPILPIASWAAAYLLFGVCLALATSPRRGESGKGAPLLLAAGQAAAVLALVALPPCFGLEGALLVVVALELGAWIPRRPAAAWIVLQSAALLAVVWLHWGWHWGIVLAGAYLPFRSSPTRPRGCSRKRRPAGRRARRGNARLEATRERWLKQSARIAERAPASPGTCTISSATT
jgi:hypothetical protein